MLEQEARQAKEQLAEMARTAPKYSALISKKETDIARVTADRRSDDRIANYGSPRSRDRKGPARCTEQDNVRSAES